MKPFFGVQIGDLFIATTGYTGEAGYEITMPEEQAAGFWQQLLAASIKSAGLGARDTLRLEAGMNLYSVKTWMKAFHRWPPTWVGPLLKYRKIVSSSATLP